MTILYRTVPYRRITVAVSPQTRAAFLRAARRASVTVSDLVSTQIADLLAHPKRLAMPPWAAAGPWTKLELSIPDDLLRGFRERARRDNVPLARLVAALAARAESEPPATTVPTDTWFLDHIRERGWNIQSQPRTPLQHVLSADGTEVRLLILPGYSLERGWEQLGGAVTFDAIVATGSPQTPFAIMLRATVTRQTALVSSAFPTPDQLRVLRGEILADHSTAAAPSDCLPIVLPSARGYLSVFAETDPRYQLLLRAWRNWIQPHLNRVATAPPELAAERIAEIVGQFPADFIASAMEHAPGEIERGVKHAIDLATAAWHEHRDRVVQVIDGVNSYSPPRRLERQKGRR